MLTRTEFAALAADGYNRIPLILELFADLDTPLSVYLKLANRPYSYLLESVVGGERFGRYSFIGLPARTRLVVNGQVTEVITDNQVIERHEGNPLDFIAEYQKQFKAPHQPNLPRFLGGLVGYFGYETIRFIEKKLADCQKPDVIGAPDIQLLLSQELAVVDNLSGKLYLVVYADPREENAYERAEERLLELRMKLREPVQLPLSKPAPAVTSPISEFGEEGFKAAVVKAKEYITDGDIMQVVLSQRMTKPFGASPMALYRSLRSLNPSPYMFYFDFEDFHVVGASPEILVRLVFVLAAFWGGVGVIAYIALWIIMPKRP